MLKEEERRQEMPGVDYLNGFDDVMDEFDFKAYRPQSQLELH